jgi:hypothetical protein
VLGVERPKIDCVDYKVVTLPFEEIGVRQGLQSECVPYGRRRSASAASRVESAVRRVFRAGHGSAKVPLTHR